MLKTVRTAVFPVAGLGTRFLPATKAVPKELLPVVDRPLIQHAVEEAVAAGVTHVVFVVSPGKESILRHFEPDTALEEKLRAGGKTELLERLQGILPAGVTAATAIQEEPLGLGHAVLCAREHCPADEHFGVILPDDMVMDPGRGALAQLVAVHEATGGGVIGMESIDPMLTASYGIAEVERTGSGHQRITSLVEKPAPEEAPSNLGVVGRYVLDGRIFPTLEALGRGAGGEIQLTDGIAEFMVDHPVYAHPLEGVRYDCGSRLGMLKANVDYALADISLSPALESHLRRVLAERG
ncbi:MAG: UTP--glucose-1-phosphate uridylyltransferase [Xanthomonadales bacterium]|jgi:UTP--glucose-1-phosphate uridylyltransferase|nr:UTP--glucose-1-phosphate uridylyltransferase [Xanthomonadales bacterium]